MGIWWRAGRGGIPFAQCSPAETTTHPTPPHPSPPPAHQPVFSWLPLWAGFSTLIFLSLLGWYLDLTCVHSIQFPQCYLSLIHSLPGWLTCPLFQLPLNLQTVCLPTASIKQSLRRLGCVQTIRLWGQSTLAPYKGQQQSVFEA